MIFSETEPVMRALVVNANSAMASKVSVRFMVVVFAYLMLCAVN